MKQCKHLETNPIVVDGVLYGYTTAQQIFGVTFQGHSVACSSWRGWRVRAGENPKLHLNCVLTESRESHEKDD